MSTHPRSPEFDAILLHHLPLSHGSIEGPASLVDLGLDSLATVSLVMELEESLDISIPDDLLIPETFASADSLWAAVAGLVDAPSAA